MRNLPGKLLETIQVTFRKKSKHKMVFLNRFIKQNIRVTSRYESYHELHENPPQFDAYIAGSDQIWNPCTMMGDMSYFLDFAPNEALKLSYASSFSGVKIPDVFKQEYINNLNRFSAISVREDNGAKAIKEITGITGDTLHPFNPFYRFSPFHRFHNAPVRLHHRPVRDTRNNAMRFLYDILTAR